MPMYDFTMKKLSRIVSIIRHHPKCLIGNIILL